MTNKSKVALALAVLALSNSAAIARETSRNAYYPVQGRTAKEVYEAIRTSSPKVAPNAAFAFTAIATKTDSKMRQSAGHCGYSSFKTSAFYIFNLPKHTAPADLSSATLAKWRNFVAYLQDHEHGHRDMWRQCFATYDIEALQLSASTCEDLDRRREKLFTSIKRKCVAKDEAFDFAFRKEVRNEPFVQEALRGN